LLWVTTYLRLGSEPRHPSSGLLFDCDDNRSKHVACHVPVRCVQLLVVGRNVGALPKHPDRNGRQRPVRETNSGDDVGRETPEKRDIGRRAVETNSGARQIQFMSILRSRLRHRGKVRHFRTREWHANHQA